ncbi:hypothetical protein C8R46DRAFT_1027751 [Mycena filopes]|nr:hypothetical protein C8R46DRAFT_1027751 [Mycena filopes]
MLALAHVSVLSLVVHASLIAVFLLVFPVAAGRLAGNTSHIYPSSFTPLSADPSSGHGLTTSHITRLPATLGVAGSTSLAVVLGMATVTVFTGMTGAVDGMSSRAVKTSIWRKGNSGSKHYRWTLQALSGQHLLM